MIGWLVAAAASVSSMGAWGYRDRVDAMSDRRGGTVYIASADNSAHLTFTCNPNYSNRPLSIQLLPTARVTAQSYPDNRGRNYVMVRLGDAPPVEADWVNVDGGLLVSEDDPSFWLIAGAMPQSTSLTLRAFNYSAQPVDWSFPIDGAQTAMDRVLSACGKPDLAALLASHEASAAK